MFHYSPADAADCLPKGQYQAELTTVVETESKASSKPMLELTWSVIQGDRVWPVRDYIVNPTGIFKLKQIAKGFQELGKFENALFDCQEHIGHILTLHLEVQTSDKFGDKNIVVKYAEAGYAPGKNAPPITPSGVMPPAPGLSDIPF